MGPYGALPAADMTRLSHLSSCSEPANSATALSSVASRTAVSISAFSTFPIRYAFAALSFYSDRLTSRHFPPFLTVDKAAALPIPDDPPTMIASGGFNATDTPTAFKNSKNLKACMIIDGIVNGRSLWCNDAHHGFKNNNY
jgi:hypothetical protein